ncbi:MAG TPA: GNAT family N-acetyltransferase [Chloroflexota bacterium]|nr:GNAT family N-acetyltransferase [Chloroflexota bacterium]
MSDGAVASPPRPLSIGDGEGEDGLSPVASPFSDGEATGVGPRRRRRGIAYTFLVDEGGPVQAPIITAEVAERIERSLAVATQSRIQQVQRLEGNPLGIDVRRWGQVTGLMVCRGIWYYRFFNQLAGLRVEDEGSLDEALAWYRENRLRCRIAISPFHANEHLLASLAQRGCRQAEFMSVMFGVPAGDQPAPAAGVTVRVCQTPALDEFLPLWLASAPAEDPTILPAIVRAEFAAWRCYVATYRGEVAGVAALHVADGVGVLAAGATRAEYRDRGCHTALLRRRIADAHAAGCDLVLSQATPGTVSQRNMERVGFHTACTQAIWVDGE